MYRKWVEISKEKLAENTQKFKKLMRGDAKLMAVVKANAYGHGSVAASRIMLKSGADWLGVSSLGEALILRENGIAAPILNLGYIHPENVSEAIENDIRLTICDLETANEINQICMEDGKKAVVHVKVDTGMNRLGFRVQDLGFRNEVGSIAKMGGLELEGIFTHFWGVSREDCRKQFNEFSDLIDSLDIDIPIKHCANSNAALNFPEFHMDCVRVGIGLYDGVMEFKTIIIAIKDISAGEGVGYGHAYIAEKPRKIAILPVGYADGYLRSYGRDAFVSIAGERAKVIGDVCMDMIMVDVTEIKRPLKIGDVVTIFGHEPSTRDVASWADTIDYEVMCAVGRRVPRVYV